MSVRKMNVESWLGFGTYADNHESEVLWDNIMKIPPGDISLEKICKRALTLSDRGVIYGWMFPEGGGSYIRSCENDNTIEEHFNYSSNAYIRRTYASKCNVSRHLICFFAICDLWWHRCVHCLTSLYKSELAIRLERRPIRHDTIVCI